MLSSTDITSAQARLDEIAARGTRDQQERKAILTLAGRRPKAPKTTLKIKDKTKAQRDAARAARWAEIRAAVTTRAGGRCELECVEPMHDAHHLLSGSGRRRDMESTANVIAVCRRHHRLCHSGDLDTLRRARGWAATEGTTQAWREIDNRIRRIIAFRGEKEET